MITWVGDTLESLDIDNGVYINSIHLSSQARNAALRLPVAGDDREP